MNCLKCGRETVSEQVFCPDCQLEMEKYPVRPGTVVQLPIRKNSAAPKKNQPKRRAIPLEEQVKALKKQVRGLIVALIIALILAACLAVPAAQHLMEDHFAIGQNYNTVIPTTPETAD